MRSPHTPADCVPESSGSIRAWQSLAIVAMLPGMVHLLVLSVALVGILDPAIWISEHLLAGPWAVLVLWALVIGGPLLSVIAGLTLELWPGGTRSFGRTWGMVAWALLIIGVVTTMPFPWMLGLGFEE